MKLTNTLRLVALLGCFVPTAYAENPKIELQGQLVLKGSLPKVIAVLVLADAGE